jgi:hypothetical protein
MTRVNRALNRYLERLLSHVQEQYVLLQQCKASCHNTDIKPNFLHDSSKMTAFYLLPSAPSKTFICSGYRKTADKNRLYETGRHGEMDLQLQA